MIRSTLMSTAHGPESGLSIEATSAPQITNRLLDRVNDFLAKSHRDLSQLIAKLDTTTRRPKGGGRSGFKAICDRLASDKRMLVAFKKRLQLTATEIRELPEYKANNKPMTTLASPRDMLNLCAECLDHFGKTCDSLAGRYKDARDVLKLRLDRRARRAPLATSKSLSNVVSRRVVKGKR